jgi:S-methyl-5-thioribose-1-phosphate isomerase
MDHSSRVETLRWCGSRLEMIDQRALPDEVSFLPYTRAAEVAGAIRDMVVRGAPAIGCAAAFGVALEALALRDADPDAFNAGLDTGIATLAASRPTAVNLSWSIERMTEAWRRVSMLTPSQIADVLLAEANSIFDEDVAANRRMGAFGADLIPDNARVLTHCNAGALATAGHGTALGVLRSAVEAGKRVSVIADETRPFLQGARLTAWELSQDGIPVTLIVDGAAAYLMSRGEIDLVVVGADRIALNGDVANKIGTYGLAVVAEKHGIPFYVAAPLSTFDPRLESGIEIEIEERGGDEVRGFGGRRWAHSEVSVRNPVFDVTPGALVTAFITDRGVVKPPYVSGIRHVLGGGPGVGQKTKSNP